MKITISDVKVKYFELNNHYIYDEVQKQTTNKMSYRCYLDVQDCPDGIIAVGHVDENAPLDWETATKAFLTPSRLDSVTLDIHKNWSQAKLLSFSLKNNKGKIICNCTIPNIK